MDQQHAADTNYATARFSLGHSVALKRGASESAS
ncbi:MAG: hypothetical protein QOD93_1045 [Acetobacteraceae bacterium]|nr:hypothetical protein [Acetobacteraceae bacterium]